MALPSGVHLLVGNQDLTDIYGTHVKALDVADVTPGGFDSASYQVFSDKYIPDIDAPVAVYDSNYRRHSFLGFVSERREKGNCVTVQCTRTTRDDQFVPASGASSGSPAEPITAKKYPPATRIGVMIRDAFQLMPDVYDDSRIVDPDIQIIQETQNFAGHTAEDLLNYVTALTTQLSTPLLWWVWDAASGAGHLSCLVVQFQDTGARYRVTISSDEIERVYSRSSFINAATVQWGNEQYASAPNQEAGEPIDHTVLRNTRRKYVNASRNIGTRTDALALAQNYLARFSQYRSTSGTITLKCNKHRVRVMPPVVDVADDNYPLHLVRSGNVIDVQGAGIPTQHFVVKRRYEFDSGTLSLDYGEIVNLESTVDLIQSYAVNRLYNAVFLPPATYPLADTDVAPVYGPQFTGEAPPNFNAGLPMFVIRSDGTLKYDGVVHPDIIADEGLEVNSTFDPSSVGFKPGPWSIPAMYNEIKLELIKSDAPKGVIADSMVFRIWHKERGEEPVLVPGGHVIVTNVTEKVQTLPDFPVSTRRGMFMFEVLTAGTAAEAIAVSIHGKKLYPDLRM